MKVVVTICSKQKNPSMELLTAEQRYLGEHIKLAQEVAEQSNNPLYILSGKFGLISGDDFIPDYDYLLEEVNDGLTSLVAAQAVEAGITEIDFYGKNKDSWIPYNNTLRKACKLEGIKLSFYKL